jgi:aldehyde dehydrogenase (NAD+)
MIHDILKQLGIQEINNGTSTGTKHFSSADAEVKEIYSPVDGKLIGKVKYTTPAEYEQVIKASQEAFVTWRKMPAPKRGEIVRQYGNLLREYKEPLGNW